MSGRNYKRAKADQQRAEQAMQSRMAEIEAPMIQRRAPPGYRKVVVTVPGMSPRVVEERTNEHPVSRWRL